jgi:hypothetical protein
MAREGDDGPMMMMLEVCEQSDNGESPPQEPAMEIVKLVFSLITDKSIYLFS